MKRTFITYLPTDWKKRKMFGDFGIFEMCNLFTDTPKNEAETLWESPLKKIKVTIEEVKFYE